MLNLRGEVFKLPVFFEMEVPPDEDLVKFAVRYKHLVKSSQVFRILVHNSEDPKSIVLDLLDWVSVKRQTLQVMETVKLTNLLHVTEVVSMQVKSLQLGEIHDLILNVLQIIVGEV